MDTVSEGLVNRFVTVDGLNLRYLEQGSGPAIIMLHGVSLGSSADVFIRNLGALAAGGYQAIAFDLPGFGLSDTPTNQELITEEELALRHRESLGKNFAAFLARYEIRSADAKGGTKLWQRLAESSVPSYLPYGREARANAFERGTLFKELYPDLNLHIVDDCRHLVPWNAAEEWVRRTLEFLKAG